MAKKKAVAKLESKQTVHGALPTNMSIYALMGRGKSPYPENTLAEYEKKLEKMDLADLQHHAVAVANILPNVHNRFILIDKLKIAFLKKQTQYFQDPNRYTEPNASDDTKKILSRGR